MKLLGNARSTSPFVNSRSRREATSDKRKRFIAQLFTYAARFGLPWIRFAAANTHVEWFVRLSVKVSHRNVVARFATTERIRGDVRLDGILTEI